MIRRNVALALAAASLSLAAVGAANAGVLDPQIFIQQSGTAPAGGDPNIIDNTSAFTVGVAGNFTLQNPLVIIVGVYDGIGGSTPAISFSGCTNPSACGVAPIGTYGMTANQADFTSGSSGTAYSQLGLSAGGSESFVNWSAADQAVGLSAPTGFELYAFVLPTSLTSGSPITIDASGAANGSFIIGYDCEAGTGSSSGCSKKGDIGQTPFTNAGLLGPPTTVPEPGALALFAAALAGMGLAGRMRWRRKGS